MMKKNVALFVTVFLFLWCNFQCHAQQNMEFKVGDVSFTMVFVQGGTFSMGHTIEQGSRYNVNELPVHKVNLDSYYIGQTEVTQALWQTVMGNNPSRYQEGPTCPVDQVLWEDCIAFIDKLNELTGMKFRLPTESEWEYAARGGQQSRGYKFSGSNRIHEVAWCDEPFYTPNHPVATKKPNELGIYDMTGNVMEWCSDYYDPWPTEFAVRPQTNPKGPGEKFRSGMRVIQPHVIRGSCNESEELYSYLSGRGGIRDSDSDHRIDHLGFRLAMDVINED